MKPVSSAKALAAALLALLCCLPASARPASGGAQACGAEREKFCASVKPGGGRVVACLKQHQAELSPACQSAMGAMADCGKELKQLCGSTDREAVRDCAKAHADELSESCRALAPKR